MARVLDFNEEQSSFFDIVLRDPERTKVHLDLPNEATINALENMHAEMEKMKSGNKEGMAEIYDLAARLINCNSDYFTVTGKELHNTYNMTPVLILKFFSRYIDFVKDLNNSKN